MMSTRRRARLAAVVASVLGALLLAGCHASANVAIRVRKDGNGTVAVTVTLDRAATAALAAPGATKPAIPLDDLRARGWTAVVSSASDGGTVVRLQKGFTGSAGLASVLADLDGRDGAVRDAHVVRTRSLLHDRDGASVLVDLSHLRAGVSDDPALAARLRAAGVDVAALDAGLNARIKGSFVLTVGVSLPNGSRTAIRVVPGGQGRVGLAMKTAHTGRLAALVAAAAAAVLGLALVVASFARARRARPA